MKNQALFSSKDKSKKLNCRLLQLLFGTLTVKVYLALVMYSATVEVGQSNLAVHL